MKKTIRIGEYFSGPGGLAWGALGVRDYFTGEFGYDVQVEPVFAVDYHEDACATYHRNIHRFEPHARFVKASDAGLGKFVPGVNAPQEADIPLVLNADVAMVRPELLGDIDGFMFGFPCNDFSMAGEKNGLNGSYGQLYKYGIKLIEEKHPQFFIAENVSGLLAANNWSAFRQIMAELREACASEGGYEVTPHLYKFEEYGVPQTRHRVIIVGIRKDLVAQGVSFLPPKPTYETMTAAEALAGVFEAGDTYPNNAPKKLSPTVQRRIELTPPGKNIWDVNKDLPEELRLKADMKAQMSSIYKVLDPDKPSYTVVGSGGGGTHMYHWDKRATTDRERATLQTFPLDYEFLGNRESVRRQIGMAVPPEGAGIIISSVVKALMGIAYETVEPNLKKAEDEDHIAGKVRARKRAIEMKQRKLKEQAEAEDGAQQPDLDTEAYENTSVELLQAAE
ncbi:DNA (cytosine-5-)-methyltransferase [Agrobacterium salinitolerans]|nr:DNA (cytosine-5-)-methyltransferase [Agrobacterium salinitolerans]